MNTLHRLLILSALLMTSFSCGKKQTNEQSHNLTHSNTVVKRCNSFTKSDSLEEVAIMSHRARLECNLSEEEILAHVVEL